MHCEKVEKLLIIFNVLLIRRETFQEQSVQFASISYVPESGMWLSKLEFLQG